MNEPIDIPEDQIETITFDALQNLPVAITTNDGEKWRAVIRYVKKTGDGMEIPR